MAPSQTPRKPLPKPDASKLTTADIRWIHAEQLRQIEVQRKERERKARFDKELKAGGLPVLPGVTK